MMCILVQFTSTRITVKHQMYLNSHNVFWLVVGLFKNKYGFEWVNTNFETNVFHCYNKPLTELVGITDLSKDLFILRCKRR